MSKHADATIAVAAQKCAELLRVVAMVDVQRSSRNFAFVNAENRAFAFLRRMSGVVVRNSDAAKIGALLKAEMDLVFLIPFALIGFDLLVSARDRFLVGGDFARLAIIVVSTAVVLIGVKFREWLRLSAMTATLHLVGSCTVHTQYGM